MTSRKEALRLAAALSVPEAGDILRRAWAQEGQHRDIRAAIISAARQRLHDPRSWPILEAAASGSPEDQIAVVAMADPFACAPRDRDHYGQLVARACRSDDKRAAEAAWTALGRWAAWADVSATITARLTDLDDRSRWQLVVPALIVLLGAGRSGSVLVDVTARLMELDLAAVGADDPSRDRPARQRLNLLVSRAADWASQAEPAVDRAPLGDAGRYLSRQPDLTLQAGTLLLAALQLHLGDGNELAGRLFGSLRSRR